LRKNIHTIQTSAQNANYEGRIIQHGEDKTAVCLKINQKNLEKEFILGHPFLEGLLQPQLQI
jgi:hypothetical protein